jgi:uncharacterized repeat protein (TIGR03803 family)
LAASDSSPYGGLTLGLNGNFYGTTFFGAANWLGTIFKITPGGYKTTLFQLRMDTGAYPDAPRPSSGYGCGVALKITATGTFSVLHYFHGAGDGNDPTAGLLQGSDGNFYGVTQNVAMAIKAACFFV